MNVDVMIIDVVNVYIFSYQLIIVAVINIVVRSVSTDIKINNMIKCSLSVDDNATSEQSQIHPSTDIISSPDKNMNDSLEKAAFGRKHLRRRSSLFFKNTEICNVVADNVSEFGCCSSNSRKALEEKVVTTERKQRRASMHVRKSIYKTRSKTEIRKFEMTYEPPPLSLKPILLSAAQKAARSITMKAKGWNKNKRVNFQSNPNIYNITPRSGKIPGVIKMPDSPPITNESVIPETTSDNMEHDVSTTQPNVLLSRTNNTFQNESVRFLPAVSKTFQCYSENEKIPEEYPKRRNDEDSSETVGIIANDDHISQMKQMEVANSMSAKAAVDYSEMSNLSELSVPMKRTKRHMEEATIMWVRGDRLRNLSGWMKEDINENKENTNLNKANDKCNKTSLGVHLHPSLLVVPRAGPKAKVKKWLEDLPNQWDHLVDGEDAHVSCQQEKIGSESVAQPDSVLIGKQPLHRISFGGFSKKQDKMNKCHRRSQCLQKAVIELPSSNRRQTIVVGEVDENLNTQFMSEGTSSFLSFMTAENASLSRCSASRNIDGIDDDVIFLDDHELSSKRRKSSIFYKKKAHAKNAKQTTANKSETTVNSSSIYNDQHIDGEPNCIPKYEKKPVMMDEMDFAPFPSISNVGYAEIASVNHDLPCGIRRHQNSKLISCNDDIFQMSLRRKSFDENKSLEQKDAIVDSRTMLRPRSARRKWSKNERWKSLAEEMQQNTWSEALRPMGIDELVTDSTIVRKLCDWIGMWKERLQKSRNSEKDVGVTSRQKRRDSDSFDSFSSDEAKEQLCNTAIIYGQYGSGKTSLVYAVSKNYEMHVLEIASNEKRNGLHLKCKLQGATHSHKFPVAVAVNQMFSRNGKDEGKVVKDSIILVDDCDVIYEKHDDGFWPALRALCKEAHTPVIIVCEDISLVRKQLGLETPVLLFPLIKPETQIVSSHLQELCAVLNISISSGLCCTLAEQYNGDLRACINHLQFYSGEENINSLQTLMKESKGGEKIEIETLPKKRHLISYNVMLRHDHSYEPGAVLSSTDRVEEDMQVVEKNDIHVAVKVTRSVLPPIEYFPLLDVILDYIPYLCIMNKASRTKMPASRRAQHYFDELHGDLRIDSSGGDLKNALTQYSLLTD
ncbi:Enhanced level of genomic instability [Dirofilaria immitis]